MIQVEMASSPESVKPSLNMTSNKLKRKSTQIEDPLDNKPTEFFNQVLELSQTSIGRPRTKKTKEKSKKSGLPDSSGHIRPTLSYNELIVEAIKRSEAGMLSLQEIYDYIQETYLFFRDSTVAWQNSIRHNLSVQKMFERVTRPATNPGKGGLWRIIPTATDEDLQVKRRRSNDITTAVNSPVVESDVGIDRLKDHHEHHDSLSDTQSLPYSYSGTTISGSPTSFKHNYTINPIDSSFKQFPLQTFPPQFMMNNDGNVVNTSFSSNYYSNCPPYQSPGIENNLYQQNLDADPLDGLDDDPPEPTKTGNHLMDTLATLALSADAQSFPWPATGDQEWLQSEPDTMKSYFPENKGPYVYCPEPSSKKDRHDIAIMLNPLVGDKTLLQATRFDDLDNEDDLSLIK